MKVFLSLVSLLLVNGLYCQDKLTVVSSASMIYDMAKNISGDLVDNRLIVPIGGDPHLYEPTPSDAKLVNEADQIFINGLTFEGWILELIKNSGTSAKLDTVTNGIVPLASADYENAYDPHAWMDVSKGIQYCTNIKNALVLLDPANAEAYQANYEAYKKKLQGLDSYIVKRINEIPKDQRVIITTHDAFAYFGKRYGLRLEALMGISTEEDATSSDIIRVSKAIKDYNVPALFIESTINPKLVKQIADDNDVKIGGELFADSLGDEKSGAHSYYDMMKKNVDTMVDALTGEHISGTRDQSEGKSRISIFLVIGLIMLSLLVILIMRMNK